MADRLQTVVLDAGGGFVKAGVAGQEAPSSVFRSVVTRRKAGASSGAGAGAGAGAGEDSTHVGEYVRDNVGTLPSFPLQGGRVSSWEDVELLWKHAFTGMRKETSEHPLLLSEPPLNPARNRETATQLVFESLESPSLYITNTATLSLYTSGRETGLVVDAGHNGVDVVPVYESVVLNHASQRVPVGGHMLTLRLQALLQSTAGCTVDEEVCRKVKEAVCRVSPDPDAELEGVVSSGDGGDTKYALPDGAVLDVGAAAVFTPEALFHPSLVGLDYQSGVARAVVSSVGLCDAELRRELVGNLVVCGGTSVMRGFGARLRAELKAELAPKLAKKASTPPSEPLSSPQHAAWIGGSILASLPMFDGLCVKSSEYFEQGPSIIHRKCG